MAQAFDITDVTEAIAEEATVPELSAALNIIKEVLQTKKLGNKVRVAKLKQELEELKPRRAPRQGKKGKKNKKSKAPVTVDEDSDDE